MLSLSSRSSTLVRRSGSLFGQRSYAATSKAPVRIAVTGAAGAIGYSMLFRLASGELLGKEQPVILQCLEIEPALKALEGVEMELRDCAFPLVKDIVCTADPNEAFEGTQFAFLVGAKPRGPGMERGDLLQANGGIFGPQGKALNDNADRDNLRVVVVGNPANTNALIASANAPDIDPKRFSALTRLDHNRGIAQLAGKLNCDVTDLENFAIWGNHSATQFPDIVETTLGGKSVAELVDREWYVDEFIPAVQQRGAAIIKARGASSAASAASSAIDHMRDWALGTDGKQTSMAVWTGNGSEGPYGTTPDVYYSFPVVCKDGDYHIVEGLPINDFQREKMTITDDELKAEKEAVGDMVKRA